MVLLSEAFRHSDRRHDAASLRGLAGAAMTKQLAQMDLPALANVSRWATDGQLRGLAGTFIKRAFADIGKKKVLADLNFDSRLTQVANDQALAVLYNAFGPDGRWHGLSPSTGVPSAVSPTLPPGEVSPASGVDGVESGPSLSADQAARLAEVWGDAGWNLLTLLTQPVGKAAGIPSALFLITAWYLSVEAQHPAIVEKLKEPFWGAVFLVLAAWLAAPQLPRR